MAAAKTKKAITPEFKAHAVTMVTTTESVFAVARSSRAGA
jgi:hypothetical protein